MIGTQTKLGTQRDERVSALMDGELHGSDIDHAIRDLEQDAELAERWNHYHLVSDSLRNDLAPQIDLQLADRIRAAIDDEPIYTAAHHWGGKPTPAWRQQAGGLAIAASLTAVSIFGAQALLQHDNNGIPAASPAVANSAPAAATALPSRSSNRLPPEGIELAAYRQPPANRDQAPVPWSKFNNLLINHQEYQAGNTLSGRTLPYVRLVNSETTP
jgi:negative regulator of sigma E activity